MVIFTKKVEILEISAKEENTLYSKNNRTDMLLVLLRTITYQKSYFLFGMLFWKAKLIEQKVA